VGTKRFAAVVATLAIAATGMVGVLASTAGAQTFDAEAELIGITANTWRVSLVGAITCTNGDPVVLSVTVDGAPVQLVSQQTESATSVIVTLPAAAPAGLAAFVVSCATTPGLVTTAVDEYAWVAVTKVVNGPAPADTTFTVNVSCSGLGIFSSDSSGWGTGDVDAAQDPGPFAPDLAYPAAGGVAYVYTSGSRDCVITEPNNGGATSTTIDAPADLYDAPIEYAATVTNVFPVIVAPTFTG